MGIVTTIPEKCRRCYTCVRECPAKAIKVEHGQATVIENRCIACGNCIKVCGRKAKQIEDSSQEVLRHLGAGEKVFACLAPSFPAAYPQYQPGQVISALKKLGFSEVWNVAFGAELVSREYHKLVQRMQEEKRFLIATPCPAIVSFVEKFIPNLAPFLAPVVSPMIATARAIRKRHGNEVQVVFIGPCTAKKAEIKDPAVAGEVNFVLTYGGLNRMFTQKWIRPELLPASEFDGPPALYGQSFPLPGGLLKTADLNPDILKNDIITTEGKDRVLSVLHELSQATPQALFVDGLFCEGCISGPVMENDLSVFARKQIVINFVNELARKTDPQVHAAALEEFQDLDLSRTFTPSAITLPQPSEEEIARVLASMKKFSAEDQLNCGACGYPTCREKAVAVIQGLAEAEMCLPYLVEELEHTCQELQKSNQDLASAQEKLVHSERLASLGQLSAGVAHEINNPLGSILLFSHVLLKQIDEGDQRREHLKMIVSEASRCKNIVRGLLDFARQSRVSKSLTNLAEIIREVTLILATAAQEAKVQILTEIEEGLPLMMIDGAQIKQMLVNLVQNSIDAIADGGEVRIQVRLLPPGEFVEIKLQDNGCGIPKENLSKIFTPFFTTKKMGKGTGLGLAIAYGVVKMHQGDIAVESEEGKGTTVIIKLPVGQKENQIVMNELSPVQSAGTLLPSPPTGSSS